MPTSDPDQIPAVLRAVTGIKPASVLEIGVGWGKWGVLVREYVDGWRGKLRLDGIEPYRPYRTAAWDAYDSVRVERYPCDLNRRYDVALLVDVLEHYDASDGIRVVGLLGQAARRLVIATPDGPYEQGPAYGNPLEQHRSAWTPGGVAAALHTARVDSDVKHQVVGGQLVIVATRR